VKVMEVYQVYLFKKLKESKKKSIEKKLPIEKKKTFMQFFSI